MSLPAAAVADPQAQMNFEWLRRLMGDAEVMRFGTATMAFTAGSGTLSVAHGLGRAPKFMVGVGDCTGGGDPNRSYYSVDSYDATNVVFRGHTPSAAVTGNIVFYWLAIG